MAQRSRVFEHPTPEDIVRANALSPTDCPRRYCWFWHSVSFDWDLPVERGCTFLQSHLPQSWPGLKNPCCRMDVNSQIDHFETREPSLIQDGIPATKFTGRPGIQNRRQIESVLLNPALVAVGKESLAKQQIELWLFVIYKRLRSKWPTQRALLRNDLQRLYESHGLWDIAIRSLDELHEELCNVNLAPE